MTCHHALSLLDELIDDELSPEEAAELKQHLSVCDACRAEHERSLQLKQLLAGHKTPEPGPEYWSEVSAIIRARTVDSVPLIREEAVTTSADRASATRRTLVRSLAVFAASLTLLIATLLVSNRHGGRPTASKEPTSIYMTADLNSRLDRSSDVSFSRQEQMRMASGTLLLGAPSMVGRYTGIAGFMTTY